MSFGFIVIWCHLDLYILGANILFFRTKESGVWSDNKNAYRHIPLPTRVIVDHRQLGEVWMPYQNEWDKLTCFFNTHTQQLHCHWDSIGHKCSFFPNMFQKDLGEIKQLLQHFLGQLFGVFPILWQQTHHPFFRYFFGCHLRVMKTERFTIDPTWEDMGRRIQDHPCWLHMVASILKIHACPKHKHSNQKTKQKRIRVTFKWG